MGSMSDQHHYSSGMYHGYQSNVPAAPSQNISFSSMSGVPSQRFQQLGAGQSSMQRSIEGYEQGRPRRASADRSRSGRTPIRRRSPANSYLPPSSGRQEASLSMALSQGPPMSLPATSDSSETYGTRYGGPLTSEPESAPFRVSSE